MRSYANQYRERWRTRLCRSANDQAAFATARGTDFAKNGLGHRPHVVYELFNGSLRKGILANENDNRPLQKISVSVVHPVMSDAYTLALRDQIRCERTEETSYDQKFQ